MSHENPTPLRVGVTGTLNGWRVRVAGRLVLSVEVDGENYFWNEFHLVDGSGNSATLVFEEGEDGPEWKVFRAFTPAQPLTAREAAAKNIGDKVNLDGTPVAITLADQSRVEFIEGEAPEGVEVGDVAHYFNADTGSRMLVASWSGDEIEFYEGLDAPADSVAAAFGFPRGAAGKTSGAEARTSGFSNRGDGEDARSLPSEPAGAGAGMSGLFIKIVLVLLGGAGLFGAYSCATGTREKNISSATTTPTAKPVAPVPAQRLAVGSSGSLGRHAYVVTDQNVVAIARTVGRHERREYLLREEPSSPALLVNGLSGGAQEWHLLRAIPAPDGLTPHEAASKRKGQLIMSDGRTATIADLFQAKVRAPATAGAASEAGTVRFGFVARAADQWILARWDEQQLEFFQGTAIPEADVIAALGAGVAKTQ